VKEWKRKLKTNFVKSAMAFIFIAFLLLNTFPAFAGTPSEPHNANAMWIEPSTIDLTTVPVVYLFNITLWANMSTLVSPAVGIDTWQVNLFFNPAYLHALATGYTNATASKSDFFELYPTTPVTPVIDNTAGYVLYGETCAPSYRPVPCYGSLCWIEFNITARPPEGPTITLVFNINNSDTWMADDAGNYYPPDGLITQYNGTAVIPEFSQHLILLSLTVLTLVTVVLNKKIIRKPKVD